MTDYIFEEDSNIKFDSRRPFCMDLVGFLRGQSYEQFMFAFDQMRKGLCLYKSKCPRFLGTLPKRKSHFYESPTLTFLVDSHAHRILKYLVNHSQFKLDL